jgi:hypothetical protein
LQKSGITNASLLWQYAGFQSLTGREAFAFLMPAIPATVRDFLAGA